LDRPAANEFMHKYILVLPDSEGPISGLVFHSRVPPSVEVDDVRGCGEIETSAAGFDREHEERDGIVLLELPYEILALLDRRLTMQQEATFPEHGAEERLERRRYLLELGEDQRLFLLFSNDLRDVAQTCELAAILLSPCAVAEPL